MAYTFSSLFFSQRINKKGSQKDAEQKSSGNYFFYDNTEDDDSDFDDDDLWKHLYLSYEVIEHHHNHSAEEN